MKYLGICIFFLFSKTKNVGGLKCEMEMLCDHSRKQQMMSDLRSLPKDAGIWEKKIKINNLEQSLFLSTKKNIIKNHIIKINFIKKGELDKFNKDNTQRINYELQTLEEVFFYIYKYKYTLNLFFLIIFLLSVLILLRFYQKMISK